MGRDTRRYLALVIGQQNSFEKKLEYCVTCLIIVIMVLLVTVWIGDVVLIFMEIFLHYIFDFC